MSIKKILIPIGILFTSAIYAQKGFKINTKVGEVSEYCYHLPCSVTKSISTKILSTSRNSTVINAIVLGGEKNERTNKIKWNPKPHSVTISCSKNNPKINGETLDFNYGIPGAMMSSAEMYFNYCHSTKIDPEVAIEKYGYVGCNH